MNGSASTPPPHRGSGEWSKPGAPTPGRAWLTQPLRRLLAEPVLLMRRLRGIGSLGFPILAYHSVSDAPGRDVETVSPAQFALEMDWLARRSIEVVSVSELVARMRSATSGPVLALSFDDGYEDNLTSALPALKRHGFRATFYVATAYIGRTSEWTAPDYIGRRPMLTQEAIRELVSQGMEIGSHSHTHADLTQIDDASLQDEVTRSRDLLRAVVGREIRGFAAPFGRSTKRVVDSVVAAGYDHLVLGGRFTANIANTSPLALRRITIGREDSPREFAKKALGAYQWLSFWDGPR